MSTTRPGGDFNYEAMEAFRNAYANQILTPEDQEIDERTGLPTNNIANTSPWLASTGLWKYPSGKGPEENLKAPFDPNNYFTKPEENEIDLNSLTPEQIDAYLDSLSNEELLALDAEINGSDDESLYDASGEMSDEEIDALIDELITED